MTDFNKFAALCFMWNLTYNSSTAAAEFPCLLRFEDTETRVYIQYEV